MNIEIDLDRVRKNVKKASTEDLLDRATVYRKEMEPDALAIIDAELAERGITVENIESHLVSRRRTLTRADETAIKCSHCYKPAVCQGWGWHKLFGKLPILPRFYSWCEDHAPARALPDPSLPES
jgi:hypothetical protein